MEPSPPETIVEIEAKAEPSAASSLPLTPVKETDVSVTDDEAANDAVQEDTGATTTTEIAVPNSVVDTNVTTSSRSTSMDVVSEDAEEEDSNVAVPDQTSLGILSPSLGVSFDNSDVAPSQSMEDLRNEISTSVTIQRKETLLLEARADRLRWIQKVSLPRLQATGDDQRLSNFLQYSHASHHLPAVKSVLTYLYGHNVDRSEAVLWEMETDQDDHAYLSGNQILAAAVASTNDLEIKSVLEKYQLFLKTLQDPGCATFVQGLRNFCRNFQDCQDADSASRRLQGYLKATKATVSQQSLFKSFEKESLDRSIESFVCGQVRPTLESLYWSNDAKQEEKAFEQKLDGLQFVTAEHLEISCLADRDSEALDKLLAEPMAAIQAIDSFHSVYEKLQRILAIYRGINASLKAALNEDTTTEKLPSADDVLPAIILIVIRTQPSRLLLNLKMVDDLSPPEYLRGEAGYAFTNLYGAVQFLEGIDVSKEPKSLHITPEALREGVEKCRKQVEERAKARKAVEISVAPFQKPTCPRVPSVQEIRQARLNGETIDLEWALRKQLDQPAPAAPDRSTTITTTDPLPVGFRRQYPFLGTHPQDIRIPDVPKLLSEYKLLVQATEGLLSERKRKANLERRKQSQARQRELMEAARSLDLIPNSITTGSSDE